MKNILTLITLILTVTFCFASSSREKILESRVKYSGEYKWGEAVGNNLINTREAAIRDLTHKIFVAVSSKVGHTVSDAEDAPVDEISITTDTYSALKLQNLEIIELNEENNFRVIAYISNSDLDKSFANSKKRVLDFILLARTAESEGRIADALRSLYRAFLLSHTFVGDLDLPFKGLGVQDAQLALSQKIEGIIAAIIPIVDNPYREAGSVIVPVEFTYDGKIVRNLDFNYYCGDGDDYISVLDGRRSFITLYYNPQAYRSQLPLQIEFAYPGIMKGEPEIENLYHFFKEKSFRSEVNIELILPWNKGAAITETLTPNHLMKSPSSSDMPISGMIKVLAEIKDKDDFLTTTSDYLKSKRLIIAKQSEQISPESNKFAVLLGADNVIALLYYDGTRYTDVKTKQSYKNYEDAFTGEASIIWIGEPAK